MSCLLADNGCDCSVATCALGAAAAGLGFARQSSFDALAAEVNELEGQVQAGVIAAVQQVRTADMYACCVLVELRLRSVTDSTMAATQ
jgi:hypothetical protein